MSDFQLLLECERCKKKVDIYDRDNVESEWLDDDEDEDGLNLWLIYWKCPYCGKSDNYDEIWD